MYTVHFSGNSHDLPLCAAQRKSKPGKPSVTEAQSEAPPMYELSPAPSYTEEGSTVMFHHSPEALPEAQRNFQAWVKQHLAAFWRRHPQEAPLNEEKFLRYLHRKNPASKFTPDSQVIPHPETVESPLERHVTLPEEQSPTLSVVHTPQAPVPPRGRSRTQNAQNAPPAQASRVEDAGDLIMPNIGVLDSSPIYLYRVRGRSMTRRADEIPAEWWEAARQRQITLSAGRRLDLREPIGT